MGHEAQRQEKTQKGRGQEETHEGRGQEETHEGLGQEMGAAQLAELCVEQHEKQAGREVMRAKLMG